MADDIVLDDLWPVGIEIIGPSSPIPERSTFQMRALMEYDNGSKVEVYPEWAVASELYGTIDENGVFTAKDVSAGTRSTDVFCQYVDSTTGSVLTGAFTVFIADADAPPTLSSIRIVGPAEVQKNTVHNYEIHARWSNNTDTVVTPLTFISSRPNVATIDVSGVAHFQKIRGDATVRFTATFSDTLNNTFAAVLDVLVVDASIYPVKGFIFGPSIVTENSRAKFGLDILFENGTNQQVLATWRSTNPRAGTLDCDGNFCAAQVDGVENTTLIASYEYDDTITSASFDLSVIDLSIRPESLSIDGPGMVREGLVVQYYTTLTFSDGTRKAVNAPIAATSNFGIVDAGNQFRAIDSVPGPSPVNLYAEYDGISVGRTIDVVPASAPPQSCYIELKSPMYVGEYQSLKLHVIYEDGIDLTVPAKWSVSNQYIAEISESGVLHAKQVVETAELVVTAMARVSGVDLVATIPVTLIDNKTFPISIRIDGPESLRAGVSTNYQAFATFSDGSERPVSPLWFCESDLVIADLGNVKASAPGTYKINVKYRLQHETVTATKEITVS